MAVDPVRQLLDYSIMHQIDLSRFGGKMVRDVITLLNAADMELLDKISKRGEKGPFTTARLKALFMEIGQVNYDAHFEAGKKTAAAMKEFAALEAESTAELLTKQTFAHFNIVQPNAEQLLAIVDKAPVTVGPDKSLLLEEVFSSLAAGKEEAIRGAIRLGMVQGETVDQMVRRLRGSRASRYTDGVLEVSRRHAESMVRTIVNNTSNKAVQMTYAANKDVVKGWEFLATLDARTTITCASLNGREFPIDQGPIPPRHVRCRSFSVPVLKSWRELGFDMDELPPSVRASKDGPVSAQLSFSDWLKDQPHDVQKDILGATRAKLFRDGGLTVDRFTDNAGVVYDLKELKARNKEAFDRAFAEKTKVETQTPKPKLQKNSAIFNQGTDALNKAFNDAFSMAEGDYLAVTQHYAQTLKLTEKNVHPHYKASKEIVMPSTGRRVAHTARHEFGHHVSYSEHISTGPVFRSAFDRDKNSLSRIGQDNKTALARLLRSAEYMHEDGLSDLFGSVTNNRIVGIFGHSNAYLKRPGARQEESAANLFDIFSSKNQNAIQFVEQHMPNLATAFNQIISDIAGKIPKG